MYYWPRVQCTGYVNMRFTLHVSCSYEGQACADSFDMFYIISRCAVYNILPDLVMQAIVVKLNEVSPTIILTISN